MDLAEKANANPGCGNGGAMSKRMMLERKHKFLGQALVEYALVIPIFLIFIMFLIDLGRLVYFYSALHNAVREGARYAVIYPTQTTQIKNVVYDTAVGMGSSDQITVTVTTNVISPARTQIIIYGEFMFVPATPLVKGMIGSDYKIKTKSTMYVEG